MFFVQIEIAIGIEIDPAVAIDRLMLFDPDFDPDFDLD